ncbi:MAG: peptidylprolyl isomerase [Caulobacteraceae bacterium]
MSTAARIALSFVLAALAAGPAGAAQAPPPATPQTFRALDPANTLVIDTNKGRVVVELYPQLVPEHVARIKTLAARGFYDGLTFFRVIDDFMAQTGDPGNDGKGGSDLGMLNGQFSFRRGSDVPFASVGRIGASEGGFIGTLPVMSQVSGLMAMTADGKVSAYAMFCPGVAGMARSGDPNSADSQFFLMRQHSNSLEQKYTAWGRVVQGMDVVRNINVGEPPANPDRMTRVRLAADLPAAERPKVTVADTTTPAFKARVDADRAAKGAAFNLCDVSIPTQG